MPFMKPRMGTSYKMLTETLYAIVWIDCFNPMGEKWNLTQLMHLTVMRDPLWRLNWEQ